MSTGNKGSSLSGGAIAGIVIGVLVGVGAVAALILWWFFFGRRKDDVRSEKTGSPIGGGDGSVTGGTIDTRRQSRGSQMSFMRNFAGDEVSPTSPTDYLSPNQAFIDNRMKKDAVLYPNGDRLSAVSLRDEEDYSRPVLRVCLSLVLVCIRMLTLCLNSSRIQINRLIALSIPLFLLLAQSGTAQRTCFDL